MRKLKKETLAGTGTSGFCVSKENLLAFEVFPSKVTHLRTSLCLK
jgi:hypothetical protein